MKKTYAYRFMLNCEPPGTLQEGFLTAHHHHHAKAKAQKICHDDVLSEDVQGKWTRWGERNGDLYGCSFLDVRTGRYGFRLLLAEVTGKSPDTVTVWGAFPPDGIPEDTAGDRSGEARSLLGSPSSHPPTPIHRLLPAW